MTLRPERLRCWRWEILESVRLKINSIRKVFLDLSIGCVVVEVALWRPDDVLESTRLMWIGAEWGKFLQAFPFDLLKLVSELGCTRNHQVHTQRSVPILFAGATAI